MKILLITGSINQGGAEYQLLNLARLLQKNGHDVSILALTDYDYYLPYIIKNHLKYSCIPNKGSKLRRLFWSVKKINSTKPDLAISYIKITSQIAMLSRIVSGFRFKLIISERTSLIRPIHDIFYFNLASVANYVTVNSLSKHKYIIDHFPGLRKKTVFIPNIIETDRFSGIKPDNQQSVRISYVGRLSPEKNIIRLVEAFSIIRKTNNKVTLTLTGRANEKYLEEIKRKVKELNLNETIHYNGAIDDVCKVYNDTDLLCLISFHEGFSNVLAEAISAGIPVIASDIEENRYLVEDGLNGYLVNPNTAEDIAAGILRFLALNETEVRKMSDANRRKAEILFNEREIYSLYTSLFRIMGLERL